MAPAVGFFVGALRLEAVFLRFAGFFKRRSVVGCMRGQASLELFFSVSLFVLVLFWMNHFVGVASSASSDVRTAALRSAIFSLQQYADAACLAQATVTVRSPCISASEPLVVKASGRVLSSGRVSVPTRCAFKDSSAVAYACGSPWCVAWNPDGTVQLTGGACP